MNYKETIESLRCCFGFGVCSDCKAKNMTEEDPLPCKLNCKERLGLHAADLIERLTAENAALEKQLGTVSKESVHKKLEINEKLRELDELHRMVDVLPPEILQAAKQVSAHKPQER